MPYNLTGTAPVKWYPKRNPRESPRWEAQNSPKLTGSANSTGIAKVDGNRQVAKLDGRRPGGGRTRPTRGRRPSPPCATPKSSRAAARRLYCGWRSPTRTRRPPRPCWAVNVALNGQGTRRKIWERRGGRMDNKHHEHHERQRSDGLPARRQPGLLGLQLRCQEHGHRAVRGAQGSAAHEPADAARPVAPPPATL